MPVDRGHFGRGQLSNLQHASGIGGLSGCLHTAFGEVVARQPDAPAIVGARQSLSFGRLNQLSDRLALNLIKAGVQPGDIVPVLLPRSLELAVAILGILKAGGAYAIAGPGWDTKRIQLSCEMVQARVAIGQSSVPVNVTIPLLPIDLSDETPGHGLPSEQSLTALTGQSPACVFFSSGTTGHAKGVLASHGAIARLFAPSSVLPFSSRSVIPISSNPSWDAFALEFWAPLLLGGTGIMIEQAFLAPDVMRHCVALHGANCAWLTSSLFNLVMDEDPDALNDLDFVVTGGERVSLRHVAAFCRRFPSKQLINGYGPVENTVFTTAHPVRWEDIEAGDIPIGRPVPQTEVLIMDGSRECAVGEIGEICTSGAGLALTYLGRSDKADAGFGILDQKAGPSKRVYRTRDIGFRDPDGVIHYIGRMDRQVKLRGMRIDTAALEQDIELADPSVGRCRIVAVRNESGEVTELVAFHVPPEPVEPIDIENLRQRLKGDVCPTMLIPLSEFPYTENGKLNETALLERLHRPVKDLRDVAMDRRASAEFERVIAGMLDDLLGSDPDTLHNNLFARGGSSLDAARLSARLSRAFGFQVSLSDVLSHPSPIDLAQHLRSYSVENVLGMRNGASNKHNALSAIQTGFLVRQLLDPSDTSSNCPLLWHLPMRLSPEMLTYAIKRVAHDQPALSANFELGSLPTMTCREVRSTNFHRISGVADALDARKQVEEFLFRPLEPLAGNLWNVAYADVPGENTAFLGIAVHHIVFDGSSEIILAKALSTALSAGSADQPHINPPRKPPGWKAVPLHAAAQDVEQSLKLAAVPPLDWGPVSLGSRTPWLDPFELPPEITCRIAAIAEGIGVPQIAVLLGAWGSALLDTTNQPIATVGVPVNLRQPETAGELVHCQLGMAAVPLRQCSRPSITERIWEASEAFRAALVHLDLLWVPPAFWSAAYSGRHFPYQTILTLHDAVSRDLSINGQTARFIRSPPRGAVSDLTLDIWRDTSGAWTGHTAFDPQLVDRSIAKAIVTRFIDVLGRV